MKVWLWFGEKRVEKRKTLIYKNNLNPVFDQVLHYWPNIVLSFPVHSDKLIFQTFDFDVPWEQIRDCSLGISVMDFDHVGRNELIGRLLLGSKFIIIPA